jgi:hypothetical protein
VTIYDASLGACTTTSGQTVRVSNLRWSVLSARECPKWGVIKIGSNVWLPQLRTQARPSSAHLSPRARPPPRALSIIQPAHSFAGGSHPLRGTNGRALRPSGRHQVDHRHGQPSRCTDAVRQHVQPVSIPAEYRLDKLKGASDGKNAKEDPDDGSP